MAELNDPRAGAVAPMGALAAGKAAEDVGAKAEDAIAVQDLDYTYPGASTPALKGVSLRVRRGEIFGLLGPSGAGKSTLQRILTRQLTGATKGAVHCLGRPIETWDHRYFERIGVGFELPNHYPRLTGAENLSFFKALYDRPTRPVAEALAEVGLADDADRPVADYSKGMAMRLNFARATLHDPELLFLDEPTSGLDPVSAGRLKRLIAQKREAGATVVLTTHAMLDVDELCDRVGFILAGEMKTVDRVEALKARFGERRLEAVVEPADGGEPRTESFPLDGLADNAAFQAMLRQARIRSLHSREASLNQVFERLTGVDLAAEDQTAPLDRQGWT